MEAKELELVLDKVKELQELKETKAALQLKELQENLIKELGPDSEHVKSIQEHLDSLETRLKKQQKAIEGPKSLKEVIAAKLNSDEFKQQVKDNKVSFSFKAIDNSSLIAGVNEVNLPFRELGVSKAPVRPLTVSQIIQWGTTSSLTVDWVERTSKVDGSATRSEGGIMGEGDLGYTEKSTKAMIISEMMKVTNEALKDTDFLASEISSELLSDLQLKLDDQILKGDGVAPNLKGITQYAQAFAAGSFALAVQNPNQFDVLRIAINQVVVAGNGKFIPNYILLHPTDATAMDLIKDANNNYILPPFKASNGVMIKGVRVIENVGITEDTYLLGDFSRAKAFMRDPLEIRVWNQNDTDAEKNMSTITANIRVAFRVKGPDANAFLTGTFSTDIAAITKP